MKTPMQIHTRLRNESKFTMTFAGGLIPNLGDEVKSGAVDGRGQRVYFWGKAYVFSVNQTIGVGTGGAIRAEVDVQIYPFAT